MTLLFNSLCRRWRPAPVLQPGRVVWWPFMRPCSPNTVLVLHRCVLQSSIFTICAMQSCIFALSALFPSVLSDPGDKSGFPWWGEEAESEQHSAGAAAHEHCAHHQHQWRSSAPSGAQLRPAGGKCGYWLHGGVTLVVVRLWWQQELTEFVMFI